VQVPPEKGDKLLQNWRQRSLDTVTAINNVHLAVLSYKSLWQCFLSNEPRNLDFPVTIWLFHNQLTIRTVKARRHSTPSAGTPTLSTLPLRNPAHHDGSGKLERQHEQRQVRRQTQDGEHGDDVSGSAELALRHAVVVDLVEELAITLHLAVHAGEEHAGAIYGEQRADAVELGGEDLQHHQRERELAQCRPNVRAFERPLRRPYLHQLRLR
jgi:hypothetical protein